LIQRGSRLAIAVSTRASGAASTNLLSRVSIFASSLTDGQ